MTISLRNPGQHPKHALHGTYHTSARNGSVPHQFWFVQDIGKDLSRWFWRDLRYLSFANRTSFTGPKWGWISIKMKFWYFLVKISRSSPMGIRSADWLHFFQQWLTDPRSLDCHELVLFGHWFYIAWTHPNESMNCNCHFILVWLFSRINICQGTTVSDNPHCYMIGSMSLSPPVLIRVRSSSWSIFPVEIPRGGISCV